MFRGIANLSGLEADKVAELMMTIDRDKCLLIYPMSAWLVFEEKIMSLPNTTDYNRGLQRTYIGYATEIELDSNGRILIPSALREFAQIDKKAVMLGQGAKLELWSEEFWSEKSSIYPDLLSDSSLEMMTEEVKNLSI